MIHNDDIAFLDIRIGDKIETTACIPDNEVLVGVVTNIGQFKESGRQFIRFRSGFIIIVEVGMSFRLLARVEPILARVEPVKVGSVISGEQVFSLPLGSHVRRQFATKDPTNTWIVVGRYREPDSPRRVVRADNPTYSHNELHNKYVIDYLPEYDG